MKKSSASGFTLVEVAIVVVIGGILLVSATSLLQVYLQKTELRVTQSRAVEQENVNDNKETPESSDETSEQGNPQNTTTTSSHDTPPSPKDGP